MTQNKMRHASYPSGHRPDPLVPLLRGRLRHLRHPRRIPPTPPPPPPGGGATAEAAALAPEALHLHGALAHGEKVPPGQIHIQSNPLKGPSIYDVHAEGGGGSGKADKVREVA